MGYLDWEITGLDLLLIASVVVLWMKIRNVQHMIDQRFGELKRLLNK